MVLHNRTINDIEVQGVEVVVVSREFIAGTEGIIGGDQVKIRRERHGDVPFMANARPHHLDVVLVADGQLHL